MELRKAVTTAICTGLAAAVIAPGAALACDGGGGDAHAGFFGHHRHHHHGVAFKGTVQSVDPANDTLTVAVQKATRSGSGLVGNTVTVKAVKGWVADTNGDGTHSIADVKNGDTVLVFTKRRFIDGNNVSAAFVVDKTNAPAMSDHRS